MEVRRIARLMILKTVLLSLLTSVANADNSLDKSITQEKQEIAYIVSDNRIPFWSIMARGIKSKLKNSEYNVTIYSANNEAKRELELTIKVINDNVDGIVISPTSSSASVTLLKLINEANIPVVIADIGVDDDDVRFLSYISSDNKVGAYRLGKLVVKTMQERGWQSGSIGIVAIPQKRKNGQLRTTGFMRAVNKAEIKVAGIKQQVNFSYEETYQFSKEFIAQNDDLRTIWLQGSDRYQAALDAIKDSGRQGEIFLFCFDAEPDFLNLIPQGIIAGSAMQQPYIMGQEAANVLTKYLQGKDVASVIQLPVLIISEDNIKKEKSKIKLNVLGLDGGDTK